MTEKRHSLLLVDDQDSNLKIIRDTLHETGEKYEIHFANNGKIAYEIAVKVIPHLIISDWEMPVMDGIKLIRLLKLNPNTKTIPVIMSTGVMTSSKNLKTALDAGAVDYIRKPIDPLELVARVRSMLRLSDSYQEILTLNALKDRMLSVIAHDLRGPVGNLSSMVEFFLESDMDEALIRDFLSKVKGSIGATYTLLENLLAWAQSQRGFLKAKPTNFCLKTIGDENLILLEQIAAKKNIVLKNDIPPGLEAFADRTMVQTIFRNLLSNAIKFTPQAGRITISALGNSTNIDVSVSDTGIGISQENIKNILAKDVLYTTYGTGNEKGSGLGIGLVMELLDLHGSALQIESKPGKGSDFIFSLPRTQ
jgi:two-component system, sensor histidine kinase and response regulator